MALSKYNTAITPEWLLGNKESMYLERKGIDVAPTKVANTIIGMLNAEGGCIVVGISDGEVQDVNTLSNTKKNDYLQVAADFITPYPNIKIEEVEVDSKYLLIYHIEQDHERLYMRSDNEDVYLRSGDETKKLSRDAVEKLRYDKNLRKFEDETEPDFQEEDFDMPAIQSLVQKTNYTGDFRDLLVARHIATKTNDGYQYKKSAVLLFTKDPEKYIPSTYIRYIRYSGTTAQAGVELNVSKDESIRGNILTQVAQTRTFIKTVLKDYYFLDMTEGRFLKLQEYPEEARLEGIVNAVVHRSYNLQGNPIYIKHYDDRLEVSNSGPLPANVTVENIKETRFSRNPRIARIMNDIGYVRELNEGVPRIFSSMKKFYLAEPVYIDKNNIVTLTLRNNISANKEAIPNHLLQLIEKKWQILGDGERTIIMHLFKYGQATLEELITTTHKSINAVRAYIKNLMNKGIVDKATNKIRDKDALYIFKQ